MASPTETPPAGGPKEQRDKDRKEQASIVNGLQQALTPDEHLLGFARGRIAGGWRGKLNVGPEAFFAPFVNVALTDRRVVLQHIHADSGKPSEILPHSFPVEDIQDLGFTDIETYGKDPAARLVLQLGPDQHFRVRVTGRASFTGAQDMASTFRAITSGRRAAAPHPASDICATCGRRLDGPAKFCPYCGRPVAAPVPSAPGAKEPDFAEPSATVMPDENPHSAEPRAAAKAESDASETPDTRAGSPHSEAYSPVCEDLTWQTCAVSEEAEAAANEAAVTDAVVLDNADLDRYEEPASRALAEAIEQLPPLEEPAREDIR